MQFSDIGQQLLFSTVRIETELRSGVETCGTGFVFMYHVGERRYPFMVTNKHVVEDAVKGRVYFHRGSNGKPLLGGGRGHVFDVDGLAGIWHGHPDDNIDVSVATLVPMLSHLEQQGHEVFYKEIASDIIPTVEQLDAFETLEEVVFVGYPNAIWDRQNLLPIMRRGATATPINVDFEGQRVFLIDASVFPGSSGSPVFLHTRGPYLHEMGMTVRSTETQLFFLGIVARALFRENSNKVEMLPEPVLDVPGTISREMIDLGVVFKASTIVEAVRNLIRQEEGDDLPNAEDEE